MKFAMMIIEAAPNGDCFASESEEVDCSAQEAMQILLYERNLSRTRVQDGQIIAWTELVFVNGELMK